MIHHDIDVPHRQLDRRRAVMESDLPDADVVIATWWETAEWVAELSPRKGAKAYFIQHHEVFDYLPKERVSATYRLPLHKITISKWLLDVMQSSYGDTSVSLVRNAVDVRQFFAPVRDKQRVPTIGFLYSTIPWKGCRTLFAAVEILRARLRGLRLIAFGHQEPSPDLPLPIGTEYYRWPPQDEIRNIYAACDLWLCGSEMEGFSLPPFEAMACRCPVVSTSVGGLIDAIHDGVNGYLVPVGNHATLAECARTVLELPPPAWRAMSDAAYQTATAYNWDDASVLFEKALQLAVERSRNESLSVSR
jgi:glycosyltransferase involved in cell wall biosynthesis